MTKAVRLNPDDQTRLAALLGEAARCLIEAAALMGAALEDLPDPPPRTVDEPPLLLTLKECGRLLRVSPNTVDTLCLEGELDSIEIGRRRLVARTALDNYIAEHSRNRRLEYYQQQRAWRRPPQRRP